MLKKEIELLPINLDPAKVEAEFFKCLNIRTNKIWAEEKILRDLDIPRLL